MANQQDKQSGNTPVISQSGGRQDMARRGTGRDPLFVSPAEFFSSNPFSLMRRMQEDMDRLFSQAFGGGLMQSGQAGGSGAGMMAWAPAIEVVQRGNDIVVHAELPGLRPEDVRLEVTDNELIIQGERRQQQESNEGNVHRSERRYGQFYRAIPLPEGVSAEQAQAAFNNGVLEVTIPMPPAQSQRRQIPIQSGSTQQAGSEGTSSATGTSGAGTSTGGSQK